MESDEQRRKHTQIRETGEVKKGRGELRREYEEMTHTLNLKVSLKTGDRFLRWTLVSNFFFLSGSRYSFT